MLGGGGLDVCGRRSGAARLLLLSLVTSLLLASGCATLGRRSASASERPYPCEEYPHPSEALESRLFGAALSDPEMEDWLLRLSLLAVQLEGCFAAQR